jgi:hypothetical protein
MPLGTTAKDNRKSAINILPNLGVAGITDGSRLAWDFPESDEEGGGGGSQL